MPVATALGRRERMWPAVSVSAMAHAFLIVWALVRREPPPIDLEQKPIVAKLVRLGEKRPEQWLPRKEAAPPPPAPPAPVPVSAPVAPQARAPAPVPGAKPAPQKPPAPSANGRSGGTSLSSILSKVQRQVDDSRWGDPNGDAAGDSEEGSEGDRYLALVVRALQANYRVPATISERERLYLKGTIVLHIEPDGRISRWSFEARSGNGAFDDALDRTLRQTRLPPPPPQMQQLYRATGLQVIFQIG